MTDRTTIDEIAANVFRISVFASQANLQFNHFLIRDDAPLLYHAGMRGMFPVVHDAVRKIIEPSKIRWIGASHFEVDEWGALNDWLKVAPAAQAVCGEVGARVNLNDYAIRPPRGLAKDEVFTTGTYRFRYCPTPHLPHGWDAGVLFEETQGTLLCSDLFHQNGDVEALTEADVIDRTRRALAEYQAGPLMDYMPFTTKTESLLRGLAELKPQTLAAMHGSAFAGDCEQALSDLITVMRDEFGGR